VWRQEGESIGDEGGGEVPFIKGMEREYGEGVLVE
jgi:hypothetical protein